MKKENNNIENIRHSLSHLMSMAVQELYPKVGLGVGPSIENGFYQDYDLPEAITPEILPKLEKRIKELIKENVEFEQHDVDFKEAYEFYKHDPYKTGFIDDLKVAREKKVSFYKSDWFDNLCAGPHVKSTKEINPDAFKLTKLAGAYWRGDEKNKMLTRIYGVAFETEKELEDYLKMMEEAEKRDHRKLGKELDLFVFSKIVGKGLPLLTPKGTIIRKELEKFVLEEETKRGYQHVVTPNLAKVELYKKSGHYPYYKDTMYPIMKVDEEELILRPMTCPHHFELYNSKPRSYKELPVRFAEIAHQYRYEKSGELSGLTRVRMFCLADAHIICTKEQADDEIKNVLDLIDYANKVFGLEKGKDYRYRLSLGDRDDNKKYYKDDTAWENAENILRSTLEKIGAPYFEAKGEAAFYGPKIDVQMKKVNGQEETAFTVQYDFVMPKRFELKYIDKDGKENEPVVIHRSSIGCFERTMAFLIEHFAGAFPLWLSPVQAVILPIGEKQNDYAEKILSEMKKENIRAEIPDSNETLGKRIREAELKKIPYILVVGDKEIAADSVSVRQRGKGDLGALKLDKLIEKLKKEISEKTI